MNIWSNFQTYQNTYTIGILEDLIDLLLKPRVRNETQETSESKNFVKDFGLTEEQFEDLFEMVPSLLLKYKGNERSSKNALKSYLMRLRTSKTYNEIAREFGVSVATLRKMQTLARAALLEDIVSNCFGFQNITRDDLLMNNTTMSNNLLDNSDGQHVITIWDGTYIACNKSFNQYVQRITYSGQKMKNLLKPMICCSPNGFIIDIFGPFAGTKNDSSIMRYLFERNVDLICERLQRGDIFMVDRGFRDSKDLIESNGFVVKMPEFIQKNDKNGQLTTHKANKSRLVTANRFAIESRNGNMKTIWKVFDSKWSAYDQKHLMEDYRIAATIINLFYAKIIPNKNDAQEISSKMLERVEKSNLLSKIVFTHRFQREIERNFLEGDEHDFEFPILSLNDLKKISLGNYQINQMNPYVVEHLRSNNNQFIFFICSATLLTKYFEQLILSNEIARPVLILAELSSRFKNRTKHQTFLLVDQAQNDVNGIIEYCCGCRHGLRTVGCCSHTMCLIGFLGYLRNNRNKIHEVSPFLVDTIIR